MHTAAEPAQGRVTARGLRGPAAQGEVLSRSGQPAVAEGTGVPSKTGSPLYPPTRQGWELGVLGTCPGTRVQGELVLMRRTWLLVRRGAGGEPQS